MPETLTKEMLRENLLIVSKSSPQWGTWRVRWESGFWTITNRRGSKVLDEGECHFWNVVK